MKDNESRRLIRLAFLLMIVVSFQALAECPVDQYDCIIDFENNPSPENFNLIETPTALQLAQLPEPQITQFKILSDYEQSRYIDLLSAYQYTKDDNRVIANSFFSQSVNNVNGHKDSFLRLQNAKGIDIAEFSGNIVGFGVDGKLNGKYQEGKPQSLYLNDYKKDSPLGKKYQLTIVDGVIQLIPRGSDLKVKFTGDLSKGRDGKLALKDGTIDGKTIKSASEIEIDKKGNVQGKAKEFNGITLTEESAIYYEKEKNLLTLNNAKISRISEYTQMYFEGSASIKNYEEIRGKLSLLPKSKFTVNNFEVKSNEKEVKLIFKQGIVESLFSSETGPYVAFSETVKIGGDVTVKVNEFDIRASKSNANPLSASILSTPNVNGRTFFREGDQFKEGSPSFNQLVDIKTVLNSWYESNYNRPYLSTEEIANGEYGTETAELVKMFQEEYNKKNPQDRISADGSWGKDTVSRYKRYVETSQLSSNNFVIVSTDGAESTVSYDDSKGKITVDVSGDVQIIAGNKKYKVDGTENKLYKEIGRSISVGMNSDFQLNVKDNEGNIVETVESKVSDYSANKVEGEICLECALANRMDLSGANCAGFVKRDMAIGLVGTGLSEEVAKELGYVGSSWILADNIVGDLKWKRESELSPEDQRLLFEVEKAAQEKYKELQAEGLSREEIIGRLRDDDITLNFPDDLKEKYRGQSLQKIHDQVLGKQARFDVSQLEDNDYLGLYHLGSNYLGVASVEGRKGDESSSMGKSIDNNRHTHSANGYWGEAATFEYDYNAAPQQSLKGFLKKTYGLKNDVSAGMIGVIEVADIEDEGIMKEAKLATDGQFYFADDLDSAGNPLPGTKRIIMKEDRQITVRPYMVRHLDGRVYNEPLAKAVDEKNSLYLVKRPDADLRQEFLEEHGITEDMVSLQLKEGEKTVTDALRRAGVAEEKLPIVEEQVRKINGINDGEVQPGDVLKIPGDSIPSSTPASERTLTQQLREDGVSEPNKWVQLAYDSADEILRQHPEINPKNREALVRLSLGVIKRESGFEGETEKGLVRYDIKKTYQWIIPDAFFPSTAAIGPAQIHLETAGDLAREYKINPPPTKDELETPEGAVKYAQLYLLKAVELYAPPERSLTSEETGLIATTYNTGLYRPRDAALQTQLQ
ncbi:hypothetical protein J4437_05240, partial [Candidatus Woesearchaeota archaeon]|nr:hypothetical protein [Candidatus Woesearchaeota archaeon]